MTPTEAIKLTGPAMRRGQSSGEIGTPWKFVEAVQSRFGLIDWDLAASLTNSKSYYAGMHLNERINSLTVDWHNLPSTAPDTKNTPLLWLNPPYSNITPWVRKCVVEWEQGAQIGLLVPGSIGANWFWDYVGRKAYVYSVGRMVFTNCYNRREELVTTPFPKDLIFCHYDPLSSPTQIITDRWNWQNELTVI